MPTQWGDTLQRIALRELGDASRWVDLIVVNGLRPPYLVATQADAGPGLLVYGDPIAIPSPTQLTATAEGADAVFGRDLALPGGLLVDDGNGDLAVVGGLDNLKQAIQIRLLTGPGELMCHADYGCHVRDLIGAVDGPIAGQLAAFYVASAIRQDDRIQSVPKCAATVTGDTIAVDATANPVTGQTFDLQATV